LFIYIKLLLNITGSWITFSHKLVQMRNSVRDCLWRLDCVVFGQPEAVNNERLWIAQFFKLFKAWQLAHLSEYELYIPALLLPLRRASCSVKFKRKETQLRCGTLMELWWKLPCFDNSVYPVQLSSFPSLLCRKLLSTGK
jgi:hypothetical protein